MEHCHKPPSWVEPPPSEPGSIDPLGYQADADKIANQLLPGTTVFTRRARYLSFLCWAIRETDDDPGEIDAWEIALAVAEYLRHLPEGGDGDGACSFLGMRLLRERARDGRLRRGDKLPRQLHRQPARIQYKALLSSSGLVTDSAEGSKRRLTELGEKLAKEVQRRVRTSRRPTTVGGCDRLFPCLSDIRERKQERQLLYEALFNTTDEAKQRKSTLRYMGKPRWRLVRGSAAPMLRLYLRRPDAGGESVEHCMREAARLELEALPLTVLFRYLYEKRRHLPRRVASAYGFQTFQVRTDPAELLLADVLWHLRKAHSLGRDVAPLALQELKTYILIRHREAKLDAPWVDASWKVLRHGMAPEREPGVHGYRLDAFASLLRDIGEIR